MSNTVLLVDDSELVRHSLRACIEENSDWQVCGEAENGQVAVEKVRELKPDVVILDLQMPVMDGLEATQKIRLSELGTARHLPIIAITANAFDDDRRRCFEAGMDGYVVKPVSPKAIGDEVTRVMALFREPQPEPVQK